MRVVQKKSLTFLTIFLVLGLLSVFLIIRGFHSVFSNKNSYNNKPSVYFYRDDLLSGSQSLYTAASLLGIILDPQELTAGCEISCQGTSLLSLQKLKSLAEEFGLTASHCKLRWDELQKLGYPAVLLVKGNRFVAVNPVERDKNNVDSIRIYDTSKSATWIKQGNLKEIWQGESLTLQKTNLGTATTKGPRIEFDSLFSDFGVVSSNAVLQKAFTFKNLGNFPLIIDKLRTSCDCSAANTDKKILQLGESANLTVSVNLNGKRGAFAESVFVHTNDPASPIVQLTLKGFAYNTHLISEPTLYFGRVRQGQSLTKYLVLRDPGDMTLNLIDARISSLHLKKNGENPQIKLAWRLRTKNDGISGIEGKSGDFVIFAEIKVSDNTPTGEFNGILEVTTNIVAKPRIAIPFEGVVVSSVYAVPQSLLFNVADKAIKQEVTVQETTERGIWIKQINVSNGLPIKVTSKKAATEQYTAVLDVVCLPSKGIHGDVRGEIICNLSDESVLKIPVYIHNK